MHEEGHIHQSDLSEKNNDDCICLDVSYLSRIGGVFDLYEIGLLCVNSQDMMIDKCRVSTNFLYYQFLTERRLSEYKGGVEVY